VARCQKLFLALILTQAAHSVEEYVFRLYDVLLPARIVGSLISDNVPLGFAVANAALVLLGLWGYVARVRKAHPSWRAWAWFWVVLEAANGTAHLLCALERGGYFPGAATAPILLALAVWLGTTLKNGSIWFRHELEEPPGG
jgi:hypothetical protein